MQRPKVYERIFFIYWKVKILQKLFTCWYSKPKIHSHRKLKIGQFEIYQHCIWKFMLGNECGVKWTNASINLPSILEMLKMRGLLQVMIENPRFPMLSGMQCSTNIVNFQYIRNWRIRNLWLILSQIWASPMSSKCPSFKRLQNPRFVGTKTFDLTKTQGQEFRVGL